jgi:hypothetical protein
MKKSHIAFIVFCIGFVTLLTLSSDPDYAETYGYDSVIGSSMVYLIPFGVFYWLYLKFEKKRKADPTIKT